MLWRAWGYSPLTLIGILFLTSLLTASCVGVTPMTPTRIPATNTPTPSPTARMTDTPSPSPSPYPTSSPTITQTLVPTPTRDPSLPRLPTPELGETERVNEGGFSFRHLVGYKVRLQGSTVTMVNDQTGIVISLSGFTTRSYGSIDHVITGLLNNMSKSFTDFTYEPYFANPVDGSDGLGSIIHGELSGERVSGLVLVIGPSKTQLFYAITFIPDSLEGSVWQSDGWPVIDAVTSSLDFFPPEVE